VTERTRTRDREERILILAPVGRDARLAEQVLARVSLASHVCTGPDELRREIQAGAGALLITDEVFTYAGWEDPNRWLGPEPPWSELPLVVLTGARPGARARVAALRRLERRRNASFLQRPVPRLTLVSAMRAALESRRRQYKVRDLLEELSAGVRHRDEFLAMLGHELRNPVGAIANGMGLLRNDVGETGTTAHFAIDLIDRQIGHLSRILDDLLDVSRITRGKLELRAVDVELGRTLSNVVAMFRLQLEARSQRLDAALPEEPVWVRADPTRVEQILWNLLSNASKYTDAGGHLTITLEGGDGEAVVRVADDGQGMTPEFVERAFEIFAQAEVGHGGLGLGLPLSRRLAEMHAGSLTATSAGLGRGSTFTLRLPLREGASEAEVPARPAAVDIPRRVLVVEDHEDLGWSLERMLQRLGHQVRRVGTGHEALAIAIESRPDVVLLDIGLPDMDGAEVAEQLRGKLGATPIVAAMTGFGTDETRRRALAAGCDYHFTKPVEIETLRALLRNAGARASVEPHELHSEHSVGQS
jgi:signal transduction histidine kinase/ActR/RegA family two-component response regulator